MKSKYLTFYIAIFLFSILSGCVQPKENSSTSRFSFSDVDGRGCLLDSESGEVYIYSFGSKKVRKIDVINGTYTIIELSETGSTTEEDAKLNVEAPAEGTVDTAAVGY
jgi:hypothetical protein